MKTISFTNYIYKLGVLLALLFLLITPISNAFCQLGEIDTITKQISASNEKTPQIENKNLEIAKADTTNVKLENKKSFRPPEISEIISFAKIVWTIITLIIGYFLIKFLLGLLNNIAHRNKKYEFTIKRTIPIIRIFGWVFISYIIVFGIYSPPAATVFAFFTSVGVAIGFAAQDLLKNVFGGLVVMFDRPFQIGDKIEAGKYYGEVVEIGIRSTKIVTPDDSLVTVPNSEFMTAYVSNSNSGENNCQVVAEIYLPLSANTERVRQIATEAAQISKYIYLNKPIVIVFFNEFIGRRSVIKMRLKAYVSNLDKEFIFKSEMTEIVIKELIKENIITSDSFDQIK